MLASPHLLVDSSLEGGVKEGVDPVGEGGVLAQEPGGVAHVRHVGPEGLVSLVLHTLRSYVEIYRRLL